MRLSACKALIWEILWRNRFGLMCILLLPFVLSTLLYVFPGHPIMGKLEGFFPSALFISLLYLLVIFSYSEFSSRTYETGFPKHVMLLPLPTWLITCVPMIAASISIFVTVLLWFEWVMDGQFASIGNVTIILCVVITVGWIQTLSWGLSKRPILAMIILLTNCFLVVASLLNLQADPAVKFFNDIYGYSILLIILLSGILLAYVSVAKARHGDRLSHSITFSVNNLTFVSLLRPFRNGFNAQFYYEIRVFGWLLPLFGLFIGLINYCLIQFGPNNENLINSIIITALTIPYIAATSGQAFAKSYFGGKNTEINGYLATRPLSCVDFSFAKLAMTASTLAIALTIWTLLTLVAIVTLEPESLLHNLWHKLLQAQGLFGGISSLFLATMGLFLISWALCSNALSLFLMANKTLNRRISIAFFSLVGTIIVSSIYFDDKEIFSSIIVQLGGVILLLPCVVLLGVIAYLTAKFKEMASLFKLFWPAMGCLFVFSLTVVAVIGVNASFALKGLLSVGFMILLLLSFLPFVTAPLSLAKNRHR